MWMKIIISNSLMWQKQLIRIKKIIKGILGKNKFLMSSDLFDFVLVHFGYYNKIPQTVWFEQQFIFLWFWRMEVQDDGASSAVSPEASLLGLQVAASCCILTCPFLIVMPPWCLWIFFFIWLHLPTCGILFLWLRSKPVPPALEARSLNNQTTREATSASSYKDPSPVWLGPYFMPPFNINDLLKGPFPYSNVGN